MGSTLYSSISLRCLRSFTQYHFFAFFFFIHCRFQSHNESKLKMKIIKRIEKVSRGEKKKIKWHGPVQWEWTKYISIASKQIKVRKVLKNMTKLYKYILSFMHVIRIPNSARNAENRQNLGGDSNSNKNLSITLIT